MKSSGGKDLLFKIVSGVPDQEKEDADKWEKEQITAVQ